MSTSIAAPAGSETLPYNSLASLMQSAAQSAESPISADALSTKEVASYIRSLSNLSFSDLRTQPQQLTIKSEALHNQLSELCISQTDAFIHIHQAERQFSPFLDTLSTHLDDLIHNALPALQEAADAFQAASEPVLQERERLQNVTDQYERGHLSDLLEIPTLVHTCVKAAQYWEAIQLAEHLVSLLNQSNDDDAPPASSSTLNHGQRSIYLSLLLETISHLSTMKVDLVSSFSKPGLKLPAARKSVSVLRRLNNFESLLSQVAARHSVLASARSHSLGMTENQLCLAFLKARIRSFNSALDAMGAPSTFSSETYLRRYIDLWREELADTLGMAFPLFIDDASSSPTLTSDSSGTDMVTPAYLVSSFAASGLVRLRDTVSVQLQAAAHQTSSSASGLESLAELFANIHTQLSYASASLTRFGFDFGKLLFAPNQPTNSAPGTTTAALSSIEALWLDALTNSLDEAFASMQAQLDEHMQAKDLSLPSRWFVSSKLPRSALEDLYSVSSDNAGPSTYDDFSRPNIELVDYPPFAKLLNQLMEWINALQVFAPISLASTLVQKLDEHFASISRRLLEQLPERISKLDHNVQFADQLLADEDAQSLLQHLDDDADTRQRLQNQLLKDRETAILGKLFGMWHSSVVSWSLHVVQSHIFDHAPDQGGHAANVVWSQAQTWIGSTRSAIMQSDKQRRLDAGERKRVFDEAVEAARVKAAEEEARVKAEEEARIKAEEEARLKAEEEARRKAEEQERLRVEEEARLKAEEEARAKAEEEARAKAAEEARLKAEEDARRKAEEDARLKAQEERRKEEARLQAEEEARLAEARRKAEKEEEERRVEAQRKADEEKKHAEAARLKAEQEEERRRLQAEAEAASAAAEAAKAKADADELAKAQAAEQASQEAANSKTDEPDQTDGAKAMAQEDTDIAPRDDAAATAPVSEPQAPVEAKPEPAQQKPAEVSEQRASSPAPKKFSLAEKLKQRREERDRAAAAAAAAKAAEPQEAADAKKEGTADAAASEADQQAESKPEAVVDATAEREVVQEDDGEEVSVAQPDTVKTADIEPSQEGEGSVDTSAKPDEAKTVESDALEEEAPADEGEEEGDDAGEDDSGANTPATPATPNPDGGGGGPSKKNKKKNKKKKK